MRLPDKIHSLSLLAFLLFGLNATAATYCVDINSTNAVPPYTNWSTAATSIQTAINLAVTGDLVLVTNGVYSGGLQRFNDPNTGVEEGYSTILIPSGVTVSSVNGAATTILEGSPNFACCACLETNAVLNGFTLTNGGGSGSTNGGSLGGGAYCFSTNVLISNCIICSNSADAGAGVYWGTLNNCILSNNAAMAYRASSGKIYSGGGAYGSVLNNCTLIGNSAYQGGGAFDSILNNCSLIQNSAMPPRGTPVPNGLILAGGGAFGGQLNSCLVISNTAHYGNGAGTGGAGCSNIMNNCVIEYSAASFNTPSVALGSALTNCTICFNVGDGDENYQSMIQSCVLRNCILYYNVYPGNAPEYMGNDLQYCCIDPPYPLTYETNNITDAPLFVSTNDFHLQSNSPCINAGNNAYVARSTDFDGNPRIVGGTVDMGAYEYQTPSSVISYAYLQQYGLPTDGSVDFADLDGTAFNVYQDWVAGLNPTNPASVLAMLAPSATNNAAGVTVTWQSVSGILYNLQRSTNLAASPPFVTITNIPGQSGITSYNDATANNDVPYFYRVSVVAP